MGRRTVEISTDASGAALRRHPRTGVAPRPLFDERGRQMRSAGVVRALVTCNHLLVRRAHPVWVPSAALEQRCGSDAFRALGLDRRRSAIRLPRWRLVGVARDVAIASGEHSGQGLWYEHCDE